jgi:hypothetical protein
MKRPYGLPLLRQSLAGAAMCCTVLSMQPLQAVSAAQPSLTFAASIPTAPAHFPLYALKPAAAPRALLNQYLVQQRVAPLALKTVSAQAKPILLSHDAVTNTVRAFINPSTNESVLIPSLARSLPRLANIHPATIAAPILKRVDVIPHDVTTFKIGNEIPIVGASSTKATGSLAAPTTGAPTTRFTFVAALRYASGYPVFGNGSRAAVAVGTDGSVQGLIRRWKAASTAGTVATTVSGAAVKTAIRSQLAPFLTHNAVTVDQVKIAYYDGNGAYLQPVYRYTAVLHPLSGPAADSRIAGFVPIGTVREAIPTFKSVAGTAAPLTATSGAVPHVQTGGVGGATISLGEYANRDNTLNGMADQMNIGLTVHPIFWPHPGPQIVRTQYYYAQPWEVVGPQSKNFLNAVNIAYTQPHGDWYINTTYSNYADLWDVRNIGVNGNPGFGAAAGGKLATWIIDSCEVVPSMYDMQIATGNAQNAFKPWWPVFKGLHNVLGFRTEMWLYDGLNTPFGLAAQLGGDLNAAWFQEIAADPAYNDNYTYYDPHIKLNVHMGRASTIIDARDLGHSIYDVAPQSASTTLWNFWMNN